MSPGPISRRSLVVGAGVTLAAAALPAGVAEAVAAATPSAGAAEGLPAVFDPRAFCRDLVDAGYDLTVVQPVWHGFDDDDLRPYYFIRPAEGRRFDWAYSEAMRRWADAMDATPDHVERVIAYVLGQVRVAS